jgi:hypothetical protein
MHAALHCFCSPTAVAQLQPMLGLVLMWYQSLPRFSLLDAVRVWGNSVQAMMTLAWL